ncbi:MAG TPA: hypothetical protein VGJ26_14880 [Pirellulales bacterium]
MPAKKHLKINTAAGLHCETPLALIATLALTAISFGYLLERLGVPQE